ncbi:AT DNA binding protein [Talaromyces pinophilus]|uniref:AT DNA binding protein n=1 Tax=Talaromyces pinophilus TaxID=128442 RepID=A0A698XM65_TALPI|nr:AT DNA binding protein [Talaromyces pinophilus]
MTGRQSKASASASPKKGGLSHQRKEPASPEKKERRRKQVRLAQRAYRARNDANVTALEQRISHLESALERMSKAIVDFNDILIEERVLTSYPHVTDHLRATLKTCLDSAYGHEHEQDFGNSQPKKTSLGVQTPVRKRILLKDSPETSHLSLNWTWRNAYLQSQILPFELDETSVIEVPNFVEHLRITCLYQGFLMLNNPYIPLDALRRPFQLFLSLVRREAITSFFYTRLLARLNHKQPEMCKEIPSFKLGGAGTHYPEALVAAQNQAEMRGLVQQNFPVIHDALPAFSPESQDELDGEWFDLWDLAGYLRSKRITPSLSPPTAETTYRMVNAVDFTAGEVRNSCLFDLRTE